MWQDFGDNTGTPCRPYKFHLHLSSTLETDGGYTKNHDEKFVEQTTQRKTGQQRTLWQYAFALSQQNNGQNKTDREETKHQDSLKTL